MAETPFLKMSPDMVELCTADDAVIGLVPSPGQMTKIPLLRDLSNDELSELERQWRAVMNGPSKVVLLVVDDEISRLQRDLATVTAERDQALADVRLLTLSNNHWRRIVTENDRAISSKEQNT